MRPMPLPPMLRTILPLLSCPQCTSAREPLRQFGEREIGCAAGHRFDPARQGYLPLLGGASRTDTGDSAAMVAARSDFLGRGHYEPIVRAVAEAVRDLVQDRPAPVLGEVGAGTAHYLAGVLPTAGRGIALDSSRYASRRAAAADPRIAAVLADAWAPLPLQDASVDAVLVVFAPRVVAEIRRVVRADGGCVVVTPSPGHLGEIRAPLGMLDVDGGKDAAVRQQFSGLFDPAGSRRVSYPMTLDHRDLRDLVSMGPAAHHRTADQIAAAAADLAAQVQVHVDVTVSSFGAR